MSYTDLRDFEAEYTVEIGHVLIEIEKLGGGTLGEAYDGHWRYIVTTLDGIEVTRGQNLRTGLPQTHARAAEILYEFLTENG